MGVKLFEEIEPIGAKEKSEKVEELTGFGQIEPQIPQKDPTELFVSPSANMPELSIEDRTKQEFAIAYEKGIGLDMAGRILDARRGREQIKLLMDEIRKNPQSTAQRNALWSLSKQLDPLFAMEKIKSEYAWPEVVKHGAKQMAAQMAKSVGGLVKMEVEVGGAMRKYVWEDIIGREKPQYLQKMQEWANNWSKEILDGIKHYYENHPEEINPASYNKGFFKTLSAYALHPKNLVQGLIETTPLMLEAGLGTAIAGPGGGIAAMAAPIAGDVYADARREGTDILPALAQAWTTGLIEASIEQWTFSRKLGIAKNITKYLDEGLGKIVWEGVKLGFRGAAEEGSQEFNRNFWNFVFTDRTQQLLENVPESFAAGGSLELAMGIGFGGAGKAVGPMVSNTEKLQRIEAIRATVNENETFTVEQKKEINQELNKTFEDVQKGVYAEAETAPTMAEKPSGIASGEEVVEKKGITPEIKPAVPEAVPPKPEGEGKIKDKYFDYKYEDRLNELTKEITDDEKLLLYDKHTRNTLDTIKSEIEKRPDISKVYHEKGSAASYYLTAENKEEETFTIRLSDHPESYGGVNVSLDAEASAKENLDMAIWSIEKEWGKIQPPAPPAEEGRYEIVSVKVGRQTQYSIMDSESGDIIKDFTRQEYKNPKQAAELELVKLQQPPAPPAEAKQGTLWGAENIGVTLEEYQAIKEKQSKSGRLKGGKEAGATILFNPEEWSDLIKMGAFHFEAGARAFADWSTRMISDLGESIRPHLEKIWAEVNPPAKEPVEKITPQQASAEPDVAGLINPKSAKAAEMITEPRGERRERGFITSVKEEFPDVETRVSGQYIPRSTDALSIKAKNLIKDNVALAEKAAQSTILSDENVAVISELIKYYEQKAQAAKTEEETNLWLDKSAELVNSVAPKATEAGRTVQAFYLISLQTPEGQLRFAQKLIDKYNIELEKDIGYSLGLKRKLNPLTTEQQRELLKRAREIKAMEDGPAKAEAWWQLQEDIKELVPVPLWQNMIDLWRAGLLTGIKTSTLNTQANLSHGVSETTKDIPASIIDMGISKITGKRTLVFTLKGYPEGFEKGLKRGWHYLKTGYDERNVGAKWDWKKHKFGNSRFAKWLSIYTDITFRVMGAEDQPFFYGADVHSLFSQAIADAKNNNLSGQAFKDHVNNLVENPTDSMLAIAHEDAKYATFQNETVIGDFLKKVQKLPVGGKVVMPFSRTLGAIATQLINYSPAGTVKTIVENIGRGRFDQRSFSQGLGRSITGGVAIYIGYVLYQAGLMSLKRPENEKEQKLWEIENRKPNSIKIGDKWRSVEVLGPTGIMVLLGGYFGENLKKTGSPTKAILSSSMNFAELTADQAAARNLSEALSVLTEPDRSFGRYFTNLGGSVVPAIIADISRAVDSTERRTEGPIQRIKSRLPLIRERLEPRLDVFGQDLPRYGGNPLEVMIDPTRPFKIKQDKVVDELRRLWDEGIKVSPTLLGDKNGFSCLTPEQNTKLWRRSGQLIYNNLFNLIKNSKYRSAKNKEKGRMIEKIVEDCKNKARAEMTKEAIRGVPSRHKKLVELRKGGLLTVDVGKLLFPPMDRDSVMALENE